MSRILVVEDSRTQAAALKDILESEGFEVALASDGREAWQVLDASAFDLVITDVLMPGVSGHELCRKIKDDPVKKKHPVILLTQLKSPIDIIQGLECGADNFITKPYEPSYLVERVREILERKTQTGQSKLKFEAEVYFLGKKFTIGAEKTQIVDLLFATFEEMVRTNQELKTSQERLAVAMAQVEQYARQMEGQARASTDKYRRLVEQANDGIFLLDPTGRVLEVNRRGEELLDRATTEIVGIPLQNFVPDLSVDPSTNRMRELQTNGSVRLHGVALERADQQTVWIDLSASMVEIGGESLTLAIVHDITERKKLEARYHQSQKMDAIGQLAGGVAHDFNNLLTVISGYSEVLLMKLPNEDSNRTFVREIQKASERAASLTRQLLVFSRKQVLEPKVLDLNAITMDTHKMLSRLIGEDISVNVVLEPNLGPVIGDQGQIEQVIMNLVLNARDSMPQGGKITIETANLELDETYTRMHPELKPGHYTLLAVTDTGCGMSEDVKARVFEPFFTTKELNKGTGLGLAMVYGIVKQCQGHISLYSEPNQGTTFRIYLPRIEKKSSLSGVLSHPGQEPHGDETILLVEDGDAVREITRQMLKLLGYRVLETSRGEQAIRLVEQNAEPIHLLVTDVVMPQMGGRQLAERLRTLRPDLKILYFSGYMDDAVVRHGILQSEVAFLHKPFTLGMLARKVREVLDAKVASNINPIPAATRQAPAQDVP